MRRKGGRRTIGFEYVIGFTVDVGALKEMVVADTTAGLS
jgi:hypothetical protein